MTRVIASISICILALLVSSFQYERQYTMPGLSAPAVDRDTTVSCDNQVYEFIYTSSARYKQYCDTLYNKLFTASNHPSKQVFEYAMKGHAYFAGMNMLGKKDVLAFIDYSLSANIKRLWVIDLKQVEVLYHELVSHGRNTGEEYARKFSNNENSYQTSLGFFITGEIYNGKHELSVRMNGMERKFNSKALDRGIVMHGADYVSEQFIRDHQRLGRSQGCPAVSQRVIGKLSSIMSDGVCLFAYYPNKNYLKNSTILRSDVVVAMPMKSGI